MDHIDLVAMRGTRFMRVQVKAGNLLRRPDRRASYSFYTRDRAGKTLSDDLIDIVALVALDQRKVVFDLPSNLKTHTVLRPEDFHQIDIERITWDNAVASIIGDEDGIFSGVTVATATGGRTS